MKSGRAQKWTARIFRWEQQPKNSRANKFFDWEDFRNEFRKEFTPAHSDALAINRLESAAYYQKNIATPPNASACPPRNFEAL